MFDYFPLGYFITAWHKGHGLKGPTVKKRRQKGQECNNEIKDQAHDAATSEEGEDIRQDLQEDCRAGD
jgi:hypothetical protein